MNKGTHAFGAHCSPKELWGERRTPFSMTSHSLLSIKLWFPPLSDKSWSNLLSKMPSSVLAQFIPRVGSESPQDLSLWNSFFPVSFLPLSHGNISFYMTWPPKWAGWSKMAQNYMKKEGRRSGNLHTSVSANSYACSVGPIVLSHSMQNVWATLLSLSFSPSLLLLLSLSHIY